jgi:alkyl sulfatase BDS1-like metallo-beta-lactamase superfamily hydrolase
MTLAAATLFAVGALSGWLAGAGRLDGRADAQDGPPADPGRRDVGPRPATEHTRKANAALAGSLPFDDDRDFEDARRGLIAPLPDGGLVKNAAGQVTWDVGRYAFLKTDAAVPDTVNPSLWRQARLLAYTGLFEVTEGIYQVRGNDLSNITFIEGKDGVTVMDPLITTEVARAALELYYRHRPRKPVVAVIHTHSHADHYGGVKGVVSEEDVRAGKVRVIAPAHFTEESISENVLAGNAMTRRATYQYGTFLPPGPRGQVTAGLGLTTSVGPPTLILPTESVTRTGQTLTIDGLTYEFQMAPGTEAPAEMHFFIREYKALCPAENATHNLHNLYTLRGAKTRDARAWARSLDETLALFGGRAEVLFAPHHWPTWGNARVVEHVRVVRDTWKYLHDQTLRLANHGYTMLEIAEMIELPDSLARNWATRGYYGSVNHNAKSIYNFYLGWYDANPATLHPLPPAAASKKYVEYMGGADAVLARARRDFDAGEYRFVAQAVNHVVLADPGNRAARDLLADALEQLGYQSENATWRNCYLMGASELRRGVRKLPTASASSPDTVRAMPLDLFFDYLGVRLNGPRAAGKEAVLHFDFTDVGEQYTLTLENGVLHHARGKPAAGADCSLTLTRGLLDDVIMGQTTFEKAIAGGTARVEGKPAVLLEFLSLLDSFDFWFDLVTANPPPKS